ncbi:hypothetical protein IQ260_25610, partial [Leptolyngbya cf. ectocarpi LEGE 11479]
MTRQPWRWLGILCAIALPLAAAPAAQADRIIIHRRRHPTHEGHHRTRRERHRYPTRGERHRYPVYERRRRPVQQQVTVEFIAQGDDWANVFVNGRQIFSPRNVNRRQRFTFTEGAYDLKITGADLFDVWAEGYLDVGRDDSNII